jgi:hypothetical protein
MNCVLTLQVIVQERQKLQVGYGQYAAMRGLAYLGRGSINRIVDDYQRGRAWSEDHERQRQPNQRVDDMDLATSFERPVTWRASNGINRNPYPRLRP